MSPLNNLEKSSGDIEYLYHNTCINKNTGNNKWINLARLVRFPLFYYIPRLCNVSPNNSLNYRCGVDVKVELVFRQAYLQGECVQPRPQSSHKHQAKKTVDGGSNRPCRESSFQLWISRIVICVSWAGHTSLFQKQGPGLDCFHTQQSVKGSCLLCFRVEPDLLQRKNQSRSSRSIVRFAGKTACWRKIWASRPVVYLIFELLVFMIVSCCRRTTIPRFETVEVYNPQFLLKVI